MPIFLRTCIICSSRYSVTSSPSTSTCPESGFNKPSTSLMMVDLPPPEPPRMIFVSTLHDLEAEIIEDHAVVEREHDVAKLDRRNRAIAIVNFGKVDSLHFR